MYNVANGTLHYQEDLSMLSLFLSQWLRRQLFPALLLLPWLHSQFCTFLGDETCLIGKILRIFHSQDGIFNGRSYTRRLFLYALKKSA